MSGRSRRNTLFLPPFHCEVSCQCSPLMNRARSQLTRGPGTHSLYTKLCSSAEQSRAEKGWGVKARTTWKMTSTVSNTQPCNLPIISFLNDCSSLPQFSLINPDLLLIYFLCYRENDLSLFKSAVRSWRTLVFLKSLSVFHSSWEKKNSACDLQSPSSSGSTASPC